MKKLELFLPVLLIALGCILTTCPNEQARKEYERQQERPKIEIPNGEENFNTPVEDSKEIKEITEGTGKHR